MQQDLTLEEVNILKEGIKKITFFKIRVVQVNASRFSPTIYYMFRVNDKFIEAPISNIRNYNSERHFYYPILQKAIVLSKGDLKSVRKTLKDRLLSQIENNKEAIEQDIVKSVMKFMKPIIKSTFKYLSDKTELTSEESENVINKVMRQLLIESLL